MAHLALSLLGPLDVMLDGQPVTGLAYDKVRALLAFLAVESDRPHRRDALAELLWPNQPEAAARHSLRQALRTLRHALGDDKATVPFLIVTRATLQFNPASDHELDVRVLTALFATCQQHNHDRIETCPPCVQRLEQVVARYRGSFLEQFSLPDSAGFEEWAQAKRTSLQHLVLQALGHITEHYARRGAYADAQAYAHKLVELDPLREESHRQLMRVLALGGEWSAALCHYEGCCRILFDELNVGPAEETTTLANQIRLADVDALVMPDDHLQRKIRRHNLPPQPLACIGRDHELAELMEHLANPACRLITLLGPGGVGKTRLAIQAAAEHVDVFRDGVYFVSLVSIADPDLIIPAMADALSMPFYGRNDPTMQFLSYVRNKELLLVLDNFEQLVEGTPLLVDILHHAPTVKLLVTSRAALNTHWEWLFELEGLRYPDHAEPEEIEGYSAVQLFLQHARRVHPRLTLSHADRAAVAWICRFVEGMPLALELATARVRVQSCQAIAEQIAGNLDVLTTSFRDVLPRHRSVRAVFEHSWNLLTESEQQLLAQLSVFRGGFQWKAVAAITGAPLSLLSALVDTCLVWRTRIDRYDLHELVRQYAAERLAACDLDDQTHARHSAYYGQQLHHWGSFLKVGQQQAALAAIGEDIDNVRVAWNWAVEHDNHEIIEMCIEGLWTFYTLRSWWDEGKSVFQRVITRLTNGHADAHTTRQIPDRLLGQLLAAHGVFCMPVGEFDQARDLCQQSLRLLCRAGAEQELVVPLMTLGYMAMILGDYTATQHCATENLAISTKWGNQWGIALALAQLGKVAWAAGRFTDAKELYVRCLSLYQKHDDNRGITLTLIEMGILAIDLEEPVEAKEHFWQALKNARVIRDPSMIALALNHLGHVTSTLGSNHEAKQYFYEALSIAKDIREAPRLLDSLVGIARLLIYAGKATDAIELLVLIQQHPSTLKETLDRADRLHAEVLAQQPHAIGGVVAARWQTKTLEQVVEDIFSTDGPLCTSPEDVTCIWAHNGVQGAAASLGQQNTDAGSPVLSWAKST